MTLDTSASTTKFSFAELERLWLNAGGTQQSAPYAAAVALAESSGYSNADNTDDPYGGSKGLWQINGAHNATGTDGSQYYDPATNAAAAVSIYNDAGGTFARDWGTWKNDAYQAFLNFATPPASSATGTTIANGTSLGGILKSAQQGFGTPAPASTSTAGNRSPLDIAGQIQDAVSSLVPTIDDFAFKSTATAVALALVAGGFALAAAAAAGDKPPSVVPVPV